MEDAQSAFEKVEADIREGKSEEEIFSFLSSFWGKSPETDGKIAERLAGIPDRKVAKLLQRMLEVSQEKRVRKMVKRSLYQLKSRGVPVEEVYPGDRRSILQPITIEPPKGYASSIDSSGNQWLLLIIPRVGRGWVVMQGVTSENEGLADFSGEEMSRKEFAAFFEDLRKKKPFPFVEMEPPYVAFRYHRAYRLMVERGKTPPQDYLLLKGEVDAIKKEFQRPLIYSYLPADRITDNDLILSKAKDLLKLELFSGWIIEEEKIRPYADAVWEAEESKIVLAPAQKEARFQEIYLKALSELFSEEGRLLYKRRLEEMAYFLLKSGRDADARTSLAAAIDLEKPINPIQPNPFLYQWVIQSIFALLAEVYEKKTKEPTLIVKP